MKEEVEHNVQNFMEEFLPFDEEQLVNIECGVRRSVQPRIRRRETERERTAGMECFSEEEQPEETPAPITDGFVWCGSGLVWSGLVWSGLVWSGLVWSGLVWSGLV